MARVAPITIAYNPRTLWFDPNGLEIEKDDPVVVRTARGLEFGRASGGLIEVEDERISALKSPLKPVERIATPDDEARAVELEGKSFEALATFKEMVADSGLDMHPVSVEFLFDGDKAVFYFESEERVDFRDLVRKLANHFHVRIDMRQIGVRDEARIIGGLGHCGQELCCKRMGGEFSPVSIRMAKEQDLSLNPQKISGLCGRLMCCLRYEFDAYKDFKSRAPKVGATVKTPDGTAKVTDLDVPREVVTVKIEDEKPVKVPLSAFEEPKEGSRPSVIGKEAWAEITEEAPSDLLGSTATFLTGQFTGTDKLAEAGSIRHNPRRRSKDGDGQAAEEGKKSGRGSRSRRKSGSGSSAAEAKPTEERRSRRRSTKIAAGEDGAKTTTETRETRKPRRRSHTAQAGEAPATDDAKKRGSRRSNKSGEGASSSGVRPGQRSSGLRGNGGSQSASGDGRKTNEGGAASAPKEGSGRRRRRRRSKGSGGAESANTPSGNE